MEEAASSTIANDAGRASQGVIVHIVSPSPELPNKLTLRDLDKRLTLGELKHHIQTAAPSNPNPARQRLIYRARPLIRDDMTLEEMFGSLELHNPDGYTLHLVLPPSPTAIGQTSAAAPQAAEVRLGSTPPPPRPASTGQIPPGFTMRPHAPTGSNHAPFTPHQQTNAASMQNPALRMGQLPPEMRQAMNYHFASLGGSLPPQARAPGALPYMGNPFAQPRPPVPPNSYPQSAQPQVPHFMPPQVQQMIVHQQQLRAAMGVHGAGDPNAASISSSLGTNNVSGEQQLLPPLAAHPIFPNNGAPTQTIVQEGQAPNGGQWRMVINGPVAQIPTVEFRNQGNAQMNQSTTSTPPSQHETGSALPGSPSGEQTANPAFMTQTSSATAQSPWQVSAQDLHSRMAQLETAMGNGITLSEDAIWQMQVSYYNYMREQPTLQGRLENPINLRFTELMARISRSRVAGQSRTFRPAQSPMMDQTGVNRLTAQSTFSATSAPIVYLLSSPRGPEALLLSPQGRYITQGVNIGTNLPGLSHGDTNVNPAPNFTVRPSDTAADGRPMAQANNNGRAVPAQDAQPDAARDLVRILLPLGGHLWLLLRLFGFVWFFMGGADWRRTFLVIMAAVIVFLSQTAAFQPLVQAVWDPIRRHVEGLVPLAAENAAHPPEPRAERRNEPGTQGQPESIPRPEDLAARLQRERNERDQGFFHRSLRRAERATALFIASLVPGVGERHIAARDAAEATRQAAERDQAEQRRRQELARTEQEAGPVPDEKAGDGEAQGGERQHQFNQSPVVEL